MGLPGAGKSTIGRQVARILGRPFLDFDIEIERRSRRTISRLFAEEGEPAFRVREMALTRELAAAPPMVLAPGGGWVSNPGVMDILRPPGRIIHLRIGPAAALARLSRSRIVRPLLQVSDPQTALEQIWDKRAGLYSMADNEIDVEAIDSQRVIELVVALARNLTPGLG